MTCKICCDKQERNRIPCCKKLVCVDCADKTGACPFCRKIWSKEQDDDFRRICLNEYAANFEPVIDFSSDNDNESNADLRVRHLIRLRLKL
jgi:hypothetical protein